MSGPEYDGAVHEATPDIESEPLAATPTGRLYQPFASGPLVEPRAHARGGRVELDGERRRARVPGGVGTTSGQGRSAGVRPGVRRGSRARGHARGGVFAREGHCDGLAVPAAVAAVRDGRRRRRRGVVPERRKPAGLVPRLVRAHACHVRRGAVRARVGRAAARGEPGGGVGAAHVERDRLVVPAVRIRGPARSAASAAGGVASYFRDAVTFAFVFPARSVQEPVIVWFGPSGPEYVGPEQEAIPEVASSPGTPSATGWLYQPFGRAAGQAARGGRRRRVVLEVRAAGSLVFPARSVQVPERDTEASSGPRSRPARYTCPARDIPRRLRERDRERRPVPPVRVRRPARCGDRLSARCVVLERRSSPERSCSPPGPCTCRDTDASAVRPGVGRVVHASTPEVASVPHSQRQRRRLYQPFQSGPRARRRRLPRRGRVELERQRRRRRSSFPALSVHVPERETILDPARSSPGRQVPGPRERDRDRHARHQPFAFGGRVRRAARWP